MPTYEYQCLTCGEHQDRIQTMREYSASPDIPVCCGHGMARYFSTVRGDALLQSHFGDRHYDGMRSTDGTPIDSRSKHREYMKRKGLTTIDDYTQTWAKAEKERQAYRSAAHQDRELHETVAREFYSKQR